MTSQPPARTAPDGTGLLVTVAAATVITVALEAAFVAAASWILLPLIVLIILAMTGLVVRAIGRVLDDGTVAARGD